MRYLRLSLFFCVFLKPVFCAHPKVDMRWSHGHQTVFHQLQHALNMLYEEFQSQRHHIGEDPWS